MTNLSCNVTSCNANKAGGCCHNSIKVEGPAANQPKETVCGTYQKHGSATNSAAQENCVCSSMEIGCTAAVCRYNKRGICDSQQVSIDCNCGCGDRSECSTFAL